MRLRFTNVKGNSLGQPYKTKASFKVKVATRIYLRLNVWTIEQYRAKCSNGTDTAFHRTYSCI